MWILVVLMLVSGQGGGVFCPGLSWGGGFGPTFQNDSRIS